MAFVGRFFLVVLFMGFVELYLLVGAARAIGFWSTLGLCVLTGVVGGSLVRMQGMQTMLQVNTAMARGELPARTIVSGVVLMLVGVLLIMPGFITDVIGFLLLIPPVRLGAAALMLRSFEKRISVRGGKGGPFAGGAGPSVVGGPFAGGPFPGGGGPFANQQPPFVNQQGGQRPSGRRGQAPVIEAKAEVIDDGGTEHDDKGNDKAKGQGGN